MPVSKSRSRKKPAYTPPAEKAAPKPNPSWYVPVMCALLILGLLWLVVTYVSQTAWPIGALGQWNLAIGFGLVLAGGGMTLFWR